MTHFILASYVHHMQALRKSKGTVPTPYHDVHTSSDVGRRSGEVQCEELFHLDDWGCSGADQEPKVLPKLDAIGQRVQINSQKTFRCEPDTDVVSNVLSKLNFTCNYDVGRHAHILVGAPQSGRIC
jgi:hypothetical protein